MRVSKPPQDTGIILEAELTHLKSDNMFQLIVTSKESEHEPCLLFNQCHFCSSSDGSCQKNIERYKSNTTLAQEVNKHMAKVEYTCSLAQEFNSTSGSTVPSIEMTCDWEGQWTPTDSITTCKCNK